MSVRVLFCLKLPVDSSVSLERLGGAVAAFHCSLFRAYITGLWGHLPAASCLPDKELGNEVTANQGLQGAKISPRECTEP